MTVERKVLPDQGIAWNDLQARMQALSEDDFDWRAGRLGVYVFNAGDDVLTVAKDAYAMFMSQNGLGPAAFPSLRRMGGVRLMRTSL